MAIARTILRNPPVLVLDEATVVARHADRAAGAGRARAAFEGRTTIAIAHRLSDGRDADQIVVLDGARRRRSGSTRTCSHRGGRFAELVEGDQPLEGPSSPRDSQLRARSLAGAP
jgi:ABC-type multidrug transport system fused ATPase/permease subunit